MIASVPLAEQIAILMKLTLRPRMVLSPSRDFIQEGDEREDAALKTAIATLQQHERLTAALAAANQRIVRLEGVATAALRRARAALSVAIRAAVEDIDFDPQEHHAIKDIDAALAALSPAGTVNPDNMGDDDTPDVNAPPKRIQRRRSKGWRLPPGTVIVTRPGKWGNPFSSSAYTAEQRVELYRTAVMGAMPIAFAAGLVRHALIIELANARIDKLSSLPIVDLRGHDLACWCAIISHGVYVPCHADVLLSLANDIPLDEVIRENTRRAEGQAVR